MIAKATFGSRTRPGRSASFASWPQPHSRIPVRSEFGWQSPRRDGQGQAWTRCSAGSEVRHHGGFAAHEVDLAQHLARIGVDHRSYNIFWPVERVFDAAADYL